MPKSAREIARDQKFYETTSVHTPEGSSASSHDSRSPSRRAAADAGLFSAMQDAAQKMMAADKIPNSAPRQRK